MQKNVPCDCCTMILYVIITHALVYKQDFIAVAGWGGDHLEISCIEVQLVFILIMDSSADYFLH